MTWANLYLVCFLVGFILSVLSVLSGSWHVHIPHLDLHHGVPHVHVGHAQGGGTSEVSFFNFGTIAAFLAWFGGTGFLLTRFWTVWFVIGLGIALISGFVGAGIIYLFLTKVLMSAEEALDPADYEMTGVLGSISVPIRAGGTGEIIYSQAGTRHTCGARAEDGAAIAKGSEVVVTRYEKGIAYVRLWEEMSGTQ